MSILSKRIIDSVIRSNFRRSSTLLSLILLLCAGQVWAQGGTLEEIIVTAEFREANVQDTPLAITAINSEMMEARSQTGLVEIAAQAPNVLMTQAPVGFGPAMYAYIRGVGQTDFNYAVEPGVGIYVDDVYYPTLTGSLIDLLDLDRVEILRGPQGTLNGRNSIGGSIKLFSKKPGEAGGYISTTYGSYNRMDVRGSADFTVLPDTLYARIAGVSKHRDGYVRRLDFKCKNPAWPGPTFNLGDANDCQLGTEGGVSYNAGRVSLRWEASDNIEVNIIGDLTNDNSEAPGNTLLAVNNAKNNPALAGPTVSVNGPRVFDLASDPTSIQYPFPALGIFFDSDGDLTTAGDRVYYSDQFVPDDPYVTFATYIDPDQPLPTRPFSPTAVPPIMAIDQWGISGQIDWDFENNMSLTMIAAYREYDSEWAQDADASPINSQMLLQRLEHDQISFEARLNGSAFDDRVDYTLGGFYFEQDGTLEANVNLKYAQLNFIHGPDPTPSDSIAGFAHIVIHVTDLINLTGGVRYTEDTKDYTHFRRNIDNTLPPACVLGPPQFIDCNPNAALAGLFNQTDHFESDRLDYRVALDYAWSDDLLLYAQTATGYKGGGSNPRPFFLIQIETFQPETLTSYEIGFKSQLLDQTLRFNTSIFWNDYQDIQLQQLACEVPTFIDPSGFGSPCLQPGNAGNADVWGFEMEGTWYPTEALAFDASVSYLDFEYTKIDPSTAVSLDMVTPYTPEWKWSIGASYTWYVGDLGSFTARIDAAYQDSIYANSINLPTNYIDDYILSNARLTWRSADEDWEGSLEVTNLTDELYYYNIFDQYVSSGTVTGAPSRPRMFAFTIKRNF